MAKLSKQRQEDEALVRAVYPEAELKVYPKAQWKDHVDWVVKWGMAELGAYSLTGEDGAWHNAAERIRRRLSEQAG